MYDFEDFIDHPKKFSKPRFFLKEKKYIDELQKQKITVVEGHNPDIEGFSKKKQQFYDKLPYFVDIDTITKNKNVTYIVTGGIRATGARHPDFFVNNTDVGFMTYILQKKKILDIPLKNWKQACKKIIEIIQYSLNTNEFMNIKNSRWAIFDAQANSFRDLCMNTSSYDTYKGKLIPTNISMLLFLFGDCREHNILLLYLMRIYFHHNDRGNNYFVTSVYASLGVDSGIKRMHFKKLNYEHTFPIVINRQTKKIVSIDALLDKTKIVKYPARQISFTDLIIHKNYYESGYCYLKQYKNKKVLFTLVDWFTYQKMEEIENTFNYVYGIKFKLLDPSLWFNKSFHEKIKKQLLNSRLCRP